MREGGVINPSQVSENKNKMQTILVVDDDAIMRATLRDMLQAEGYDVVEAKDGNEAMRIVGSTDLAMIVTDILMPDKDGIELILEVNKTMPDINILAISGGGYLSADNYLSMACDLGAKTTLVKPFEIDSFINEVNKCLHPGVEASL